MHEPGIGFLDDVPVDELAEVLGGLDRRHFAAGATVLAEGDAPRGVYVIETGLVDILATDRHNVQHQLSRLGPGATLGEMSVFTGQSTSAAARAVTDVDVLILGETDLRRAATAFPRLYWNLGAILSRRLASSNRRLASHDRNQTTLLLDDGAPPTLGYALACSVAWHTRRPTLLLVLEAEPAPELAALAGAAPSPAGAHSRKPRAYVQLAAPVGSFAPDALDQTVDELHGAYDHVLVQIRAGESLPELTARRVRLACADSRNSTIPHITVDHTLAGWTGVAALPRPNTLGVVRVPALARDDEAGLNSGIVSIRSPAGKALGWTARRVTGLGVGLALGAGGVWGYAHIGVLRALARFDLPVDYLAGTSVGAGVAALFALGYEPEAVANILDSAGAAAFRLTFPVRSILSSNGIRAWLRHLAADARIEDLSLPLAIVAADILTQREVVFREGPVWPALLASMSIPGIYPPVVIGPYTLVDGGILNPVPSNVAAEMGAGTVIAVKLVGTPAPAGGHPVATVPRAPFVLQTLLAAMMSMQGKITADTAAAATVLIEVQFESGGAEVMKLRSFTAGRRHIAAGEAAADAALPRLVAAFPWLET